MTEDQAAKTEISPSGSSEDDTSTVILSAAEVAAAAAVSAENPMTETFQMAEAPAGLSRRILKISCHNCQQKLDVTYLDPFSRINCPTCGTELIVPQWFDSYLLEEPGGQGGMATVFRALDIALDREVAIKVLKPEVANDQARAELFLHEARTAATINHYAVVPIYTCGIFEGQTYIIMQYMAGGSLESKLKLNRGVLPLRSVVTWMRDIAEGLDNARLHGIVHHDVKPGNIMLDNEGNAKIGDFGIAQVVSGAPQSEELRVMAQSWVSPYYVSPEKVRTGQEGFHGDIYSLGATFYHLAAGAAPFNHSDIEELIRMRLTADPMPPHLLRPEIGPDLSRLILAMMARNPVDRPDYRTILTALNEWLKNASVPAAVSVPVPPPAPAAARSFRNSAARTPYAPARKGHTGEVLTLLILLGLLVGGGWYLWDQGLLQPYLPGAASPSAPVAPGLDPDPNPEVSLAFASGNPGAAAVYAKMILTDRDALPEYRLIAALQYVLSLYLQKDPDALVKAAEARSLLESGLPDSVLRRHTDEWNLLAYLAEPTADAQLLNGSKLAVLKKSCEFIRTAYEDAAPASLPGLLQELRRRCEQSSGKEWPVLSWLPRIPYWTQAVVKKSGDKNDIEPVFAASIASPASWDFKPAVVTAGDLDAWLASAGKGGPAAVRNETGRNGAAAGAGPVRDTPPDISPAAIKKVFEEYKKLKRPTPSAPALISMDRSREYLQLLPGDKRKTEKARIAIMAQTVSYIAQMSAKNPYQAKSFRYNGRDFGPGTGLFNERYLVYRGRRGSEKLDWKQVPAKEIMSILLYYTTFRENAARNAPAEFGEMKKELGRAFLRYALMCAWYGNYGEADRYARKTMELLPSPRTYQVVEHMFLQ